MGGYFQRNDIRVRILQSEGGFPTDITPVNQRTTTGLFAQGSYQLTDTFEVQVGGRYSTYKATGRGFVTIGRGFVTIGRGVPGFPADGLPVALGVALHQRADRDRAQVVGAH